MDSNKIIELIIEHRLVIRKINSGFLCKAVPDNGQIVMFYIKHDNFSETLEGSISLYLKSIEGKKAVHHASR